ncbi:MAG: DUF3047 domain-containing protein [Acetobacteraceae bacterium]|nr:DUF3047 domain-containing protein [Acetobacteraceae bacterium]
MPRLATAPLAAPLVLLLPPLLAGPAPAGSAAHAQSAGGGSLEAAGWRHGEWRGVPPARFRALPGGGVAVRGEAQASFVWRPLSGAPGCLSWRWRVDEGPPATDLTRRGGDDKALSVAVGFSGWPPDAGAWQRARHGIAQAAAGDRPLPRSVLLYVWGGTGREPALFAPPYLGGLARVRVLRPADAPRGRWLPERVDLAADWRAAFGGEPPPVQEVALGTDVDDTASRVDAAVEAPVLAPCG